MTLPFLASAGSLITLTGAEFCCAANGNVAGPVFQVSQSVSVTSLGTYNGGGGANPAAMVWLGEIGVSGTLASASVSYSVAGFNFSSISPVTLDPGHDYFVVSQMGTNAGYADWASGNLNVGYTLAPGVSLLGFFQNGYYNGTGTIAGPNVNTTILPFGPNLQFDDAGVPEPGTVGLLSFGLVGLAWKFRRKKA